MLLTYIFRDFNRVNWKNIYGVTQYFGLVKVYMISVLVL